MLKSYEIREIIKMFDQSSLQEMQIKTKEHSIKLKKGGTSFPAAHKPPVQILESEIIKKVEAVAEKNVPPVQQPTPTSKGPVQVAVEVSNESEEFQQIVSPMVGTFYAAPAEDAPPFVNVGDRVEKSTIVCIVEAMKLFNEIEADCQGEIVKVLVQNGQLVEQGQPLFLVKPE